MPSKNLCHNLSVCSGFVNFATSKSGGSCRRRQGEMVEWSITPVLKTGIRRRIGGSNPSLSAKPADYFSGFYFYKKFPKYYQSVFGGQRIIPVGSDWSDMSDEIYPKVILL